MSFPPFFFYLNGLALQYEDCYLQEYINPELKKRKKNFSAAVDTEEIFKPAEHEIRLVSRACPE
jgi:hypothetical protein